MHIVCTPGFDPVTAAFLESGILHFNVILYRERLALGRWLPGIFPLGG